MGVKKAKEYRFTFKDSDGDLRVVYLQAQHFCEDGKDVVRVQATSDGVPIETAVYTDEDLAKRVVKTQTDLAP